MCKKLLALAYVPPERVLNFYELLVESLENHSDKEILLNIFNRFRQTYILFENIQQDLSDPRFKIGYWNFFGCNIHNTPRTKNHQEGWHRGFNALLGGKKTYEI